MKHQTLDLFKEVLYMNKLLDLNYVLDHLPAEPGIHSFVPGFHIVVHLPHAETVELGTLWDVKDLRRQTIYRIHRTTQGLEVEIFYSTTTKTRRFPLESKTLREAVLEIMDFPVLEAPDAC